MTIRRQSVNVRAVVDAMESIAPPALAEDWDNVGLLIGEPERPTRCIMLTIDLTEAVAKEAIANGADMVITYHPPIFRPIKRLVAGPGSEGAAYRAAAAGIAVYSPHTALDAAPDGLNDFLCEAIEPQDAKPLAPHGQLPATEQRKIVTFCPASDVERIREAMGAAGAGTIGAYSLCSFEVPGTGTFFGDETTRPAVGKKRRLERVPEVRLEMVCGIPALSAAVASLRAAHSYEEPPIEIYELQPRPSGQTGAGRIARARRPLSTNSLAARVCSHLGVRVVQATGTHAARHTTIGFCAGAGGSLLNAAIEAGCSAFVTGELRHHDVLHANARGCDVVLAGHTNTERPYLPRLRKRLKQLVGGLESVLISRNDRDPLRLLGDR